VFKALSESQRNQYRCDGFVFPLPVLSEAEAAAFAGRMERAYADGKLDGMADTKFYLRFPWVHEGATRPGLLDMIEDLIGPDIMLYHNTVWSKEGGDGRYVSWHQDNTYFGHDPCEVLTVWLAITPATDKSGCMEFLAGTHRLGQLALRPPDATSGNLLSSGQTSDIEPSAYDPVAVELRPGEASVHHAFLVHGSRPNRADHRRLGIALIYHRPGLRQFGECRTSALLVRGQDNFNHFDHERPPKSEDDPETLRHFEAAVARYRAKVRELGNATVGRFD